jgi:hypothetical protein
MHKFFNAITGRTGRTQSEMQQTAGSTFSRRVLLPLLMTIVAVTVVGQSANAALGNDIAYFGTQPAGTPAFGQTVMVKGMIIRRDRGPIANQMVQLWFSGRHGARDQSYYVRTDKLGRFNVLMTIPSSWRNGIRGDKTWVDVNISCISIGVTKLFRVRNK